MEYDNSMLNEYLEEIGLSDKEAQVYLALLEVENATISDIAKKTKVNRTTVYPVLQSLEKKGLASEVPVGKKIHYQAAPPERLESFIERQKVVLEEHSARLKDIIPQIKSVSRDIGERPIIKFFEGYEGAVSAFEEFYADHKSTDRYGYFVFNRDLLEQTISERDQQRFLKIRQNKHVEPITVYTKKSGEHEFTTPGQRVRIDQDKYPLLCEIVIINDKVAISTLTEEKFTILIKSKDIATTIASLVQYVNDAGKKRG